MTAATDAESALVERTEVNECSELESDCHARQKAVEDNQAVEAQECQWRRQQALNDNRQPGAVRQCRATTVRRSDWKCQNGNSSTIGDKPRRARGTGLWRRLRHNRKRGAMRSSAML